MRLGLLPAARLNLPAPGGLLLLCGLLLGGCGDGEGAGSGVALGGRLRECGLVGAGELRPRDRSELNACIAQCRVEASCDELVTRYCSQAASGQLLSCEGGCFAPQDCASGRGSYTLLERCDGRRQCDDGSDERGCGSVQEPPRYCESGGERIWTFQLCNGIRDCKDGTDENGCPSELEQFVCKGSIPQRVLRSQVCDLVPDCLDGSDESAQQGCAQLSCPRKR